MSPTGTGGYHPHESPLTMLVPIVPARASARSLAGPVLPRHLRRCRSARRNSGAAASRSAAHLAEAARELGLVGQADADHRHAARPVDRVEQLHPRSRGGRRASSRRSPAVYRFVSTNGISTSSTTSSSSGPRCGSAGCSGRAVTRARSTASARTARLMRSASATGSPTRLQSGYLYSYALVMLLGLIGAASWAIWWAK